MVIAQEVAQYQSYCMRQNVLNLRSLMYGDCTMYCVNLHSLYNSIINVYSLSSHDAMQKLKLTLKIK